MAVNILVIEDEQALCDLLEFFFQDEGHRTTIVHSDEEAYRAMSEQQFDVVLSDMSLSGSCGLEFIVSAKRKFPQIHYILMSGYELNPSQKYQLDEACAHFISKPFHIQDLNDLILSITRP